MKSEKSRSILTFIQMGTVMVCLNTAFRIRGVNMEGVEMGTNRFDWAEVLIRGG